MLAGATTLTLGLLLGALLPSFYLLLPLWFAIGLGYSLAQTPSGRLLRRSSNPEDRPALFAAQFALSHACWLFTYPVAGWLGTTAGLPATFLALAIVAGSAVVVAVWIWPANDPESIEHTHENLPATHPHLAEDVPTSQGPRHSHAFVIDSIHPEWPRPV